MGPMYKLLISELQETKTQIAKLLENCYIHPSISSWGSPVLFTSKKDGGLRMWTEYRALNKKSIGNQDPYPRIDETWEKNRRIEIFFYQSTKKTDISKLD